MKKKIISIFLAAAFMIAAAAFELCAQSGNVVQNGNFESGTPPVLPVPFNDECKNVNPPIANCQGWERLWFTPDWHGPTTVNPEYYLNKSGRKLPYKENNKYIGFRDDEAFQTKLKEEIPPNSTVTLRYKYIWTGSKKYTRFDLLGITAYFSTKKLNEPVSTFSFCLEQGSPLQEDRIGKINQYSIISEANNKKNIAYVDTNLFNPDPIFASTGDWRWHTYETTFITGCEQTITHLAFSGISENNPNFRVPGHLDRYYYIDDVEVTWVSNCESRCNRSRGVLAQVGGRCRVLDPRTNTTTEVDCPIPNAFTPNNYALYPLWWVKVTGGVKLEFKVFNRWGNLFYQKIACSPNGFEDYLLHWNGEHCIGEKVNEHCSGPILWNDETVTCRLDIWDCQGRLIYLKAFQLHTLTKAFGEVLPEIREMSARADSMNITDNPPTWKCPDLIGGGRFCPPVRLIDNANNAIPVSQGHKAAIQITGLQTQTPPGKVLKLQAGRQIRLIQNFHAPKGSTFHAYIKECDDTPITLKKIKPAAEDFSVLPPFPIELQGAKGAVLPPKEAFTQTLSGDTQGSAEAESLFRLYPNPFGETITVAFYSQESQTGVFTLYQPDGKKIKTFAAYLEAGIDQKTLDFADLPPGFYLLELEASGRLYREKIIKR